MKRYLPLVFLLLLLVSCSDESFVSSKVIMGEWERTKSISGMTGQITNYPPGNDTRLFYTKNTFEIYSNGNLVNSGTYKIKSEVNPLTQEKGNRIIYNGDNDGLKIFFKIIDDKLELSFAVHDGGGSVYQRIAN